MLFASILRLMPVDREKARSQPAPLTLEEIGRVLQSILPDADIAAGSGEKK